MENTTTPAVTPSSVGIRYGLLTGIATIIYSLILKAGNLEQVTVMGLLVYVILIVGIVLAHKFYKRNSGGFMSYGQGLGIATVSGIVIGALSGLFNYIYVNFIDSEYIQRATDAARAKMEADGNLTEEQIDQGMKVVTMAMPTGPLSILWAILAMAFFAFLLALVISAFTKNTRPEFE